MARSTTLDKAGKTFVVAKPVTPDYVSIASRMAEAIVARGSAAKALDDDYAARKAALDSPMLTAIKSLASEVPNCTLASFVEHIQPAFIEALGQKSLTPNLIKYRIAFLAFANGIAAPAGTSNVQAFANDVARPALIASGILEESKRGRTKGATAEKPTDVAAKETAAIKSLSVDGRIEALASIFPGTKAQRNARVNFLSIIVEHDPDGKLFDAMLAECARAASA